jgi:hypothetical protein
MRNVPAALVAALCAVLLTPGCKSREKPKERPRALSLARLPVADRPEVLAELPGASVGIKSKGAPPPAAGSEFVFAERGGGVAWVAPAGERVRVVHNGKAGSEYDAVSSLAVSPDGRRYAYGARGADGTWRMVVDGVERGRFEEVGAPGFSPDGAHLVFSAKVGAEWHLVVDEVQGPGTRGRYVTYELSREGSRVAFLEAEEGAEWGRLVVADRTFERLTLVEPRVSVLLVTPDHSRLVSIAERDGAQRVLTLFLDRPEDVTRGREYESISWLGIPSESPSLAYLADRPGGRVVVLDDRDAPAPPEELVGYPMARSDGKGCGVFVAANGAVTLREFFVERGAREGTYDEAEMLTYAHEGREQHAYVARRGDRWFIVANGREGPAYDRVVTPAFSPDGRRLVYRARQDGKRFVVVADAEGKTIRQHPAYEQVFPVQFTADGKSVAYGVKDGRQLAWKVEAL